MTCLKIKERESKTFKDNERLRGSGGSDRKCTCISQLEHNYNIGLLDSLQLQIGQVERRKEKEQKYLKTKLRMRKI